MNVVSSPKCFEKIIAPYFADLADVTLADEDNNSIPTDDANRTIIGNVAMHLVAKLVTNASSATWWAKLEPIDSLT